ncbi:common pilus major fimbrillin subunit EcpA [Aeromonas hydrophila]|uniref:common pilus major fimbrillin subunit EcpA n=1 Tax=Aeromonas hydrophila TaxID=644 RepID=UPI0013037CA3|nr:common pilus major fimbrillin subunit EcpA [Aeromonas hydrophila]QGZ71102.1 fimbrial protein [Aeromonas hydrophila]
MKKTLIALALVGFAASSAHAATEATSVATWKATATKDSSEQALIVTPLGGLDFKYASGIKRFNTIDGMFDIAIKGSAGTEEAPITGFTLKAKKIQGRLTDTTGSTIMDVGVQWQGEEVPTNSYLSLIDTKAGKNGGALSAIGQGFKGNSDARGSMTFNIINAESGGKSVALSEVPEGLYQGSVDIEFVANWS